MARTGWKGPYTQYNFKNNKNLQKQKKAYIYNPTFKITRNSEIVPKFKGLLFKVHNGKKYFELLITNKMIGFKFGAFCKTRS